MIVTKKYLTDLTYKVTGAAIEVHKILGPGLLESVYHKCMAHEMELRGIPFKSEFQIPFSYKGINPGVDFKCDFWVNELLIVELKACNEIAPIFEAKVLNHMNLTKSPKGLLLNFNVTNLYRQGQYTYVNKYFDPLLDE